MDRSAASGSLGFCAAQKINVREAFFNACCRRWHSYRYLLEHCLKKGVVRRQLMENLCIVRQVDEKSDGMFGYLLDINISFDLLSWVVNRGRIPGSP